MKALLHTHSGLGDMICCYAITVKLLEKYDEVYIPCKEKYSDSVGHLYKDLDNVFIMTIPDDTNNNINLELEVVNNFAQTENLEVVRIGFHRLQSPFHYKQFFDQAGVEYFESWDLFPDFTSTENSKSLYENLVPKNKEYALLINENSYGKSDLKVETDLLKVTMHKTDLGAGIFDWIDVIVNASEIHSVGTGPFHFIDRIKKSRFKKDCKFYFHNVRDDFKTVDTELDWILQEYEQTPYGYWRSNP